MEIVQGQHRNYIASFDSNMSGKKGLKTNDTKYDV